MLRILFMGTPDFAVPALKAVHESGHELPSVVTQPDRPKGRGLKSTASSVKQWAINAGLHVIQPPNAKDPEFIEMVKQMSPDLIITAAYGHIITQELLDIPSLGCINVHASLLPEYRGASPIQHAILDGKSITGITVFFMDAGMDTGDIILQLSISIMPEENAQNLHDKLSMLGAEAIRQVLAMFEIGKPKAYPQNNQKATYCKKIDSSMGKIDWTKEALRIKNHVRALTPWPGAYSTLGGKYIKLSSVRETDFKGSYKPGLIVTFDERNGIVVACGEGFLRLLKLQKSGGKVMNDTDFVRGYPILPLISYFS